MAYKLPLKSLAAGALIVATAAGISLLPSGDAAAQRSPNTAPSAAESAAQLQLSTEDQALLFRY